MRNKTLYINKVVLGLAVSLLLGSCAKLAVETEQAISMSVKLPGQTKSVVTDLDAFKTQGSFGVFGYKLQDNDLVSETSPYHVFVGQNVTYGNVTLSDGTTTKKWYYDPLKYWDQKEGMWYNFIAYAPYSNSTATPPTADPNVSTEMVYSTNGQGNYYALQISDIPSWQDASLESCKDFMISNPERGKGTDFVNNADCTVNFTFKHILALIDLYAYVADGMDYSVYGISVGKDADGYTIPTDNGNVYSQGIQRVMSDGLETSSWIDPVITASSNKGVATWYSSTDHDAGIILDPEQDTETAPKLISKQLAFPFSVTKLTMNVSFVRSGTLDDTASRDIDLSSFESGKHYTITLRFEGGDIVDVNVSEVQDWNAVTVNHGIYNW